LIENSTVVFFFNITSSGYENNFNASNSTTTYYYESIPDRNATTNDSIGSYVLNSPTFRPTVLESLGPTVGKSLIPTIFSSQSPSTLIPTFINSHLPSYLPTPCPTTPKTSFPSYSNHSSASNQTLFVVYTWQTYLKFLFNVETTQDLLYTQSINPNRSSIAYERGILLQRSIIYTYLKSTNNLVNESQVTFGSINSTYSKSTAGKAKLLSISPPISTVTLNNKLILANGSELKARSLYNAIFNASSSYPSLQFQKTMAEYLNIAGLKGVNFTFLSLSFNEYVSSVSIITSTSSPALSPATITRFRPSNRPITTNIPTSRNITSFSSKSPVSIASNSNPIVIQGYMLAVYIVLLSAILAAGFYYCCTKSKNKRKIHDMMDEAEIDE